MTAGYQFEVNRSWISEFGISWHLGIDGISLFLVVLTGILFPIAILATDPHHDAKRYYAWLLLLQAGCLGRVHVARSLPLLRDVRDRAGADVLPDRRLGLRQPGLRGAQVLPVHDARLGADAGRHRDAGLPRPRRPSRTTTAPRPRRSSSSPTPGQSGATEAQQAESGPPAGGRAARLRPGRDRRVAQRRRHLDQRRPAGLVGGALAVPGLRHRLRREGAAVPAAHVVARRPHRGADARARSCWPASC